MSSWTWSFTSTLLPTSFAISFTRVSSGRVWSNATALNKLSWAGQSGALACVVGVGQCLWEKLLDLGQRGPSFSRLPCHRSGLLHLCSLWQKISLLFLHISKGLPSPGGLLMQIVYGKACPSLSVFSVSTRLYIAVLAVWCQTKGPHHLGPKNASL